jgi:hypothetical protein
VFLILLVKLNVNNVCLLLYVFHNNMELKSNFIQIRQQTKKKLNPKETTKGEKHECCQCINCYEFSQLISLKFIIKKKIVSNLQFSVKRYYF